MYQEKNSKIDLDKFKFDREPDEDLRNICTHFGCGKELTQQEQLFGNKCIKHSKDDKRRTSERD